MIPQSKAEEVFIFTAMNPPKKADIRRARRENPIIKRLGSLKDREIAENTKDRVSKSTIDAASPIAMLFINRDTVESPFS